MYLGILVALLTLSSAVAISEISFQDDGMDDDRDFLEEALSELADSDEAGLSDRDEGDDDSYVSSSSSSSSSSFSSNGGNSFSYSSSVTNGNGQTVINGVDTSKLPPNYHKVKEVKRMVNGRPVYVNVTIDKKTDPVTGEVSVSVSESSGGSGKSKLCNSSNQCKTGYYCRKTLYVNACRKCSNIKQRCVDDAGCCGDGTTGALCVYGRCRTGFHKGDAGTICKTQGDCKKSMCCSRSFMKGAICKPLAKKGQKCAASKGSMNNILHPGTCPCVGGLVCTSGSWTERFFGGSMNTLLGGNTCRLPKKKAKRRRSRWSWWKGRDMFDDGEDDIFSRFD